MWEFLVALGVVVALVADALTIFDIVEEWWMEHKHRRMEAGDKEKPGCNRAS